MLYFIVFLFFLSVFMLFFGILNIFNQDRLSIETRVEQIKDIQSTSEESISDKTFSERAVKPFYDSLTGFLIKITPKHTITSIGKKLEKAGMLKNITTEKWVYIKSMIALTFGVLFGSLVFRIKLKLYIAFIIASLVIILINEFFNFYLLRQIENRKRNILKSLPYTLDLITVSVEAGLSFDGAMTRVINNLSGELCDEFGKSLKEIKMGIQRQEALRNMSERCDVKELSTLVTSLIQADELGVSLGKVLRIEAANLREHRKQSAREKAMKAPIKMLFPLIFFIFPSIFIIILGPAIIKIIAIF
jgi:tight adherence protein C